jgi:hypothetical protein
VARGEPGAAATSRSAPDRAEASIEIHGDSVQVTIRAPVPLLGARLPALAVVGSAYAAVEPGSPEPVP